MIAITGIGLISPLGIGTDANREALASSRSCLSSPDGLGLPCRGITTVGAVNGFVPKDHIPAMKARRMSRFSQLGLAAAIEAVGGCGIAVTDANRTRIAVAVGTGLASTDSTDRFYEGLLREGPEGTNPIIFPETVQNIAAAHIAMHFGTRGQNITFSHADISSELALFFACGLLQDGLADAVIVAGADELSSSEILGYAGFGVLSNRMLPYDRKRSGFVLSEGGAALVLERQEDAAGRGARIRGLVGTPCFASSPCLNTAYDTSGGSLKAAMQQACAAAGTTRPDLVSGSANSSRDLDRIEASAVAQLFGSSVPVTALRGLYGWHPSDGLLRIALSALCMEIGCVPAIPGLQDPEEPGLDLVADVSRSKDIRSVIIPTLSPGGSAAAVMLRRPQ